MSDKRLQERVEKLIVTLMEPFVKYIVNPDAETLGRVNRLVIDKINEDVRARMCAIPINARIYELIKPFRMEIISNGYEYFLGVMMYGAYDRPLICSRTLCRVFGQAMAELMIEYTIVPIERKVIAG
jgi:hypothetical protein